MVYAYQFSRQSFLLNRFRHLVRLVLIVPPLASIKVAADLAEQEVAVYYRLVRLARGATVDASHRPVFFLQTERGRQRRDERVEVGLKEEWNTAESPGSAVFTVR